MVSVRKVILGLALAAGFAAPPALADDPSFLTISVGAYDVFDDGERPKGYAQNRDIIYGDPATEFGLQYRSDQKLWIFKPHAGAMATSDAAYYVYGGILTDVYFGNRFVLTPSTAVGYYQEGDGKRLGSVVEFRSGIELAYRFDNRMRLGLGLYHMSNADIGDENPGTESATLNLSVPTTLLFGGGAKAE